MPHLEVGPEALQDAAARLQEAGAGLTALDGHLAAGDAACAGDRQLAAALAAFVGRLGQTVPALARGHEQLAAALTAAAARYISTDQQLGRSFAPAAAPLVGFIGQAGPAPALSREIWSPAPVPEPRGPAS